MFDALDLIDPNNNTNVSVHTCVFVVAGGVELPHVELQADDGEHEDGHEE